MSPFVQIDLTFILRKTQNAKYSSKYRNTKVSIKNDRTRFLARGSKKTIRPVQAELARSSSLQSTTYCNKNEQKKKNFEKKK